MLRGCTKGATANTEHRQAAAPEDGRVARVNNFDDLAQLFARQLIHIGAQRLLLVHLQRSRVVELLVLDDALDREPGAVALELRRLGLLL